MGDHDLLRRYCEEQSEEAFAALVERYLGMVMAVALRKTGDHALSEEIAQNVFTILARKAHNLKPGAVLAGWLHRTAVLESAHAMRSEYARKRKMKALSEIPVDNSGALPGEAWTEVIPHLDEAMNQLNARDRDVLFLRFFEGKTFREIGKRLGKSESATHRQAHRAVERLSAALKRKGVLVPTAVVAAGLTAELIKSVPAPWASTVARDALEAAANAVSPSSALGSTLLPTAMNSTTKITMLVIGSGAAIALFTAGGMKLGQTFSRPDTPNSSKISRPASLPPQTAGHEQSAADLPPAGSDPEADGSRVDRIMKQVTAVLDNPVDTATAGIEAQKLLAQLSASEMPPALDFVESTGVAANTRLLVLHHLFHRWAELEGQAAFEVAAQRLDHETLDRIAWPVSQGWASQNPSAAFAWYESLEAGHAPQTLPDNTRKTILTEVMRQWLAIDPEAAAAVFESLPFDTQKTAKSAFMRFADDPQHRAAIAQTITQIRDQTLRIDIVENFGEKWAKSEPEEASAWFDAMTFENPVQAFRAAAEISESWFERDPEGAADWLWPKVPDEAWREEFIESLVGKAWVERDRQAAAAWLEKMGYDPAQVIGSTTER